MKRVCTVVLRGSLHWVRVGGRLEDNTHPPSASLWVTKKYDVQLSNQQDVVAQITFARTSAILNPAAEKSGPEPILSVTK